MLSDDRRPSSSSGLRDFWSLYDEHFERIHEITLEAARNHPQLGVAVAARSPADLEAEAAASRERMRAAADGNWAPYDDELRLQGTAIAAMGIGISAWHDLAGVYSRHLVPLMVERFGDEPARLTAALLAMQSFVDRALATVAESYLAAKEARILESEVGIEASRKRLATTEAALIRSEARFSCLWVSGVVGISIESRGGRVLEANDALLELCGRDHGDLAAGRIDWTHLALDQPNEERARAELERDGTTMPFEREIALPGGGSVSSLVGATMLADERVIAIHVDTSEKKRLDELRAKSHELEAQNRRVLEASRLKSEFLANMSHELRTPLNSIIGFAELLHDGEVGPLADQQREFIGDILTSGRHLLQLINDVLDLSKVEAGKMDFRPETVDPEKPILEVVSLLRTQAAEKRLRIAVEVEDGLDSVYLDVGRFKQVLYNYLSNALKFTERGAVRVCLRKASETTIRLDVQDEGPGISRDDQRRLFVEFSQLDAGRAKRHQGTGLGLALTRRLVEAQGGTVGVESEPGAGSTFFAVLPRQAIGTAALPLHRSISSPAAGAPRVLVIEDDAADQDQIAATLTRAGYSVETAATAAQALALVKERRYDAITLDLILPDRSGVELLADIRSQHGHDDVPVVVITVVTEHAVAGFVVEDILEKPIDETRLLEALRGAGVEPAAGGPVFVVDDDAASLRLMAVTLERLGYQTKCFESAAQALEACEALRPSSVILDLLMPEMDGFQFLDRFRGRAALRRVPVLLWTVKELTAKDWGRLERGVQAVVPKARVTGDALAAALRPFLPPPVALSGAE